MRTELGEFLVQYRMANGLQQTEVVEKLEKVRKKTIGGGYLSRVEGGDIRKPRDGFLTALAAVTGKAVEDLRQMCRPVTAAVTRIKMACGHSVWNAPIVCAASEGQLPELEISSFYRDPGGDELSAEHLVPVVQKPAADSELVPLSAANVLDLLRRGKVDVGAVPGNLVRDKGHPGDFICVGTIVDSASGCTLVSAPRSGWELAGHMDTADLGMTLSQLAGKAKGKVRVGAEEGTIACDFLRQAWRSGGNGKRSPEEIVWHCPAAKLRTHSFGKLAEECREATHAELVGVVAWEPHVTWLTAGSVEGQKSASLRSTSLQFAPQEGTARETHLTYEVVVQSSCLSDPPSKKRELFQALTKLMAKANSTAARMNAIHDEPETVVRRLAAFYGFTDATAAKVSGGVVAQTKQALGRVLYSVRWNVVAGMGIGPQV